VLGSEGAHGLRFNADATYEAHAVAFSLNGIDDILALPAEADYCCVDHEPAGRLALMILRVMFGQLD
jgi:hypothetical protein